MYGLYVYMRIQLAQKKRTARSLNYEIELKKRGEKHTNSNSSDNYVFFQYMTKRNLGVTLISILYQNVKFSIRILDYTLDIMVILEVMVSFTQGYRTGTHLVM